MDRHARRQWQEGKMEMHRQRYLEQQGEP